MSTAPLSSPLFSSQLETSLPRKIVSAFCAADLAMDLGTANTLIYLKRRGIILNQPSIVAVEEDSHRPLAIGQAAKDMFGKTSRAIECIRPMKDGVIAHFDVTKLMIRYMLRQTHRRWRLQRPRLVVGVPSGITQVEKKAVIEAALSAGVREVLLVEEPMAAALGCNLPVHKAVGNMIVDIGGGTTEVAILSMNGTIYSHSIRVAGDEMDEAIQQFVKRKHGVLIGIFEAERIKLLIGSALPFSKTRGIISYGRDVTSGFPTQIELCDEDVREALHEPVSAIIASIVAALEQTRPEIAQDIMSRGIYLAGGGALLKGLAERLERETGIPFHRAHDPLSCVVRGVGKIVDELSERRVLCIS